MAINFNNSICLCFFKQSTKYTQIYNSVANITTKHNTYLYYLFNSNISLYFILHRWKKNQSKFTIFYTHKIIHITFYSFLFFLLFCFVLFFILFIFFFIFFHFYYFWYYFHTTCWKKNWITKNTGTHNYQTT
jgi:hypothetical protein